MEINNKALTLEEAQSLITRRQRNTRRIFSLLHGHDIRQRLVEWYVYCVRDRGRQVVRDDSIGEILSRIADFISKPSAKWGLMLMGRVGTGKTVVMRALQSLMLDCAWQGILPADAGLRVVTAKSIITREGDRLRELFDEPMLAIDDLGNEAAEKISFGSVSTPIVDLLEYRYERQLLTVVTTNLDAGQIAEKYGQRVADRCREMFEVLLFKNNSFRC